MMNTLSTLMNKLKSTPESVTFDEVIDVIEEHYLYTPTQFRNGTTDDGLVNIAGDNEGSCKIFYFAQIQKLNKEQTLHCFGQYYRNEVLNNPDESNHSNIRTFMEHGWGNIAFDGCALKPKQ